jgi:predicted AAA+ superfamily ATPase
MFNRHALVRLDRWMRGPRRKPLVIRGARQVGKSTLVRSFANEHGLALNEVNLERHRSLERAFETLDVGRIERGST